MSMIVRSISLGLTRGWIELRQQFMTRQEVLTQIMTALILCGLVFMSRNNEPKHMTVSVGLYLLPSLLGMVVGFNGMIGMAQVLTTEREDGTLLRAKTLPGGMPAYLIGKIVTSSAAMLVCAALLFVPCLTFLHGLALTSRTALLLVVVVVLGLLATLPAGAIFGSILSNPRALGLMMLPVMGMSMISGIFFPLSSLPKWLQIVGQIFPLYWLGLGTRSALLPSLASSTEIDGSWRTPETLCVLLLWATVGLFVAPVVLGRMARRESGSAAAARKQKALQRTI